jgi:hypothetical protein
MRVNATGYYKLLAGINHLHIRCFSDPISNSADLAITYEDVRPESSVSIHDQPVLDE